RFSAAPATVWSPISPVRWMPPARLGGAVDKVEKAEDAMTRRWSERASNPGPLTASNAGALLEMPSYHRSEDALPAEHTALSPHISTSAPSSMTRSTGMRKKSVDRVA